MATGLGALEYRNGVILLIGLFTLRADIDQIGQNHDTHLSNNVTKPRSATTKRGLHADRNIAIGIAPGNSSSSEGCSVIMVGLKHSGDLDAIVGNVTEDCLVHEKEKRVSSEPSLGRPAAFSN